MRPNESVERGAWSVEREGDSLTPHASRNPPHASRDTILELGINCLLALLLFSSVAFMGGRYDWGWLAWSQPVFVGILASAAMLWLFRLALRPQLGIVFSWSLVLLAAGGLIGILQLVALPAWLLRLCSPGLTSILPLWSVDGAASQTLGAWNCTSLVPQRTAESLRYFAMYCLTFFLVIQNVRTLTAVKRLLLASFLLGIATALCGLVQYFFWNDKFFGFFSIPWVPNNRLVRSPFTNQNHFAGFLAMTVGPGCYWLATLAGGGWRRTGDAWRVTGGGRQENPLLQPSPATHHPSPVTRHPPPVYLVPIVCVALGCVMVASFLTVSRGGIIATTLAFALAAGGMTFFIRSRQLWLFAAILTCLIFVAFLSFADTNQIQERLATLGPDQQLGSHSELRLVLWQALLKSVPDFPILGTGFGSHRYIYQLYLEKFDPVCFSHAENCYLQLLVEGGMATGLVMIGALGCIGYWCLSSLRGGISFEAKPGVVAVMAALSATAFHGAVDCVWYLPSHAFLLAVLAGLACVLARMQRPGKMIVLPLLSHPYGVWFTRTAIGAAGIACALVFTFWLQTSYHHAQAALLWTDFQTSPDGEYPTAKTPRSHDRTLLALALNERPDEPKFHARSGELCLRQFFQSSQWKAVPMPLTQLGEAVRNSRFDSPAQRDRWLDVAYGSDNRKRLEAARDHFSQAVRLCPLQAGVYLRLAELEFLATPGKPSVPALLDQAIKADPFNPDISYQAGAVLLQLGDSAQAMQCWNRCAKVSEKHKQTILAQLATVVDLPPLIEHFQPDYASLLWLARERFVGKEQQPERLLLLNQAEKLTKNEPDPQIVGLRMAELHQAFLQNGAQEQAGRCARAAVAAQPYLLASHLHLARWLFQQGLLQEAKTEIDWCAGREPGNPEVRALHSAIFDASLNYRKF